MDERENLIIAAFERISSAGAQPLDDLFTVDAIYEGAYVDAQICGARAISIMMGQVIPAAITPFRQWPIGVLLSPGGTSAAVEYRSEGTSLHSGSPYRNLYMGALRFSDGLISYWREYYDPALFAAAVGPQFEALVGRLMPADGMRAKPVDRSVFG